MRMTNDMLDVFYCQVIAERRQSLIEEGRLNESGDLTKNKKMAFHNLMLINQQKYALSNEDIRDEVDTFMFAGHDTTSSGMG
ncbi:hypothetical protein PENTCL1PPCAC_16299, partial [Pristionchus entomophagus]